MQLCGFQISLKVNPGWDFLTDHVYLDIMIVLYNDLLSSSRL